MAIVRSRGPWKRLSLAQACLYGKRDSSIIAPLPPEAVSSVYGVKSVLVEFYAKNWVSPGRGTILARQRAQKMLSQHSLLRLFLSKRR